MAWVMGTESTKLEKDLEGLKKRIQASKRKLRESEVKARKLQSSIQTALLAPEKTKRNRQG